MQCIAVIVVAVLGASSAQFFQQQGLPFSIQPPPLHQNSVQSQFVQQPAPRDVSHRAVVLNAEREAQLPPHLLNPFYKNPRISAALAKESWFGPGETPVVHREAEKIPRQQIYSVLKNAGLVNRRR